MNGRRVIFDFLFFAVAIIAMAEQAALEGKVAIVDTTVTLVCPAPTDFDRTPDVTVTWHKDGKNLEDGKEIYIIENYTDKNNGLYYCSWDPINKYTHYFFIKAKVCERCVDLEMSWALLVVFADILFTLGIVFLVYKCTQKRNATATPQRQIPTRQQRPQARGPPPPPDPDYQPLNPATRSNDIYSSARH